MTPWCSQPRTDPNFLARNIWLLVSIQQKSKEFFADHHRAPHQEARLVNAGGIGFGLPPRADAMKRLKELEWHTAGYRYSAGSAGGAAYGGARYGYIR